MVQFGFIGMGNMGKAIFTPVKEIFGADSIIFHRNSMEEMKSFSEKKGVKYVNSNKDVAEQAKYIILAVKPQMFKKIIDEIKENIKDDSVIISLAPGITIEELEKMTGRGRIVRAMPNTPAMVGQGMTGVCYDSAKFSDDEKEVLNKIFNGCGLMEKIDEKLMNAVVCASGSSPAYVFMFIEALADSVVECGLPRDKAYKMVAQTVLGSAKLMLETGKHPGELKDMVCSPGGTTIAAVSELEKQGLRKSLFSATEACFEKCNRVK